MSKDSITLVGRASRLKCHSDHVSFLLTVKGRGNAPELVFECKAFRQREIEAFESMDQGSLVGIIGTLRPIQKQEAHSTVLLDRLEILGKPVQPREVAA
jgi:hypothetical protein